MWLVVRLNKNGSVQGYWGRTEGTGVNFVSQVERAILFSTIEEARYTQGRQQANSPEVEITKIEVQQALTFKESQPLTLKEQAVLPASSLPSAFSSANEEA